MPNSPPRPDSLFERCTLRGGRGGAFRRSASASRVVFGAILCLAGSAGLPGSFGSTEARERLESGSGAAIDGMAGSGCVATAAGAGFTAGAAG